MQKESTAEQPDAREPDFRDIVSYWGLRIAFAFLMRLPANADGDSFIEELLCEGGPNKEDQCKRFGNFGVHVTCKWVEPPLPDGNHLDPDSAGGIPTSLRCCSSHAREWQSSPGFEETFRLRFWHYAKNLPW